MSDPTPIAEADLFTVPLLDGGVGLGQVISPDEGGAVHVLISDLRTAAPRAIPDAHVLSVLFTEARAFRTGAWTVIGYERIPSVARVRRSILDDAPAVQDPAVIEAYLNAIHGLYPWDGFPDPEFFSSLLLPEVTAPEARRMQSQFS